MSLCIYVGIYVCMYVCIPVCLCDCACLNCGSMCLIDIEFCLFLTYWSCCLSCEKGGTQKHDDKMLLRRHDVFLFTLFHITTISTYICTCSSSNSRRLCLVRASCGTAQCYGDDISMVHLTYPGIPCERRRRTQTQPEANLLLTFVFPEQTYI